MTSTDSELDFHNVKIPFFCDESTDNSAYKGIFENYFGNQIAIITIPKGTKDSEIIKLIKNQNVPNFFFTKDKKHKYKFSFPNTIEIYISNSSISSKEIKFLLTKFQARKGFRNKDIRYWLKKYKGKIIAISREGIKYKERENEEWIDKKFKK